MLPHKDQPVAEVTDPPDIGAPGATAERAGGMGRRLFWPYAVAISLATLSATYSVFLAASLVFLLPRHLMAYPVVTSHKLYLGGLLSSGLAGAAGGTMAGAPFADRLGRRPVLMIALGALAVFSGVGACAPYAWLLLLSRVLSGVACGLIHIVCKLLLYELCPVTKRSRSAILLHGFWMAGAMLSFLAGGAFLHQRSNEAWRWHLAASGFLSLSSLALVIFVIPESPRWLISTGKTAEGLGVLRSVYGRKSSDRVNDHYNLIAESFRAPETKGIWTDLLKKKYRKPLLQALLLGIVSQLAGTTPLLLTILYMVTAYPPAGAILPQLWQLAVGCGLAFVPAVIPLTAVSANAKRMKRQLPMVISFSVTAGALLLMAIAMGVVQSRPLTPETALAVILVPMVLLIGAHSSGAGPLAETSAQESLPSEVRCRGQAFALALSYASAFALCLATPLILQLARAAYFLAALAVAAALGAVAMKLWFVETRGSVLEEIDALHRLPVIAPTLDTARTRRGAEASESSLDEVIGIGGFRSVTVPTVPSDSTLALHPESDGSESVTAASISAGASAGADADADADTDTDANTTANPNPNTTANPNADTDSSTTVNPNADASTTANPNANTTASPNANTTANTRQYR